MNTLGTLLLWCVLQVTLVAVATMIAYFLARRGGASLRSSVVLAGLITATLLVPLAWSPWPRWELPRAAETINEPPQVVKEVAMESTSTGPAQPNIEPINNLSPSVELEPITWRTTWNNFVEALENPESSVSPVSPASPDPGVRWPTIVLGLFGAALLVGVARLVGGYWSVRRTIRQARRVRDPQLIEALDLLRAELSCPTPIEIRETHKTATAAASGWQRPVILLPVDWRGWTSEQTRAVLAHELAHVVRRDYLTACIAQILLALHFYHPLWQWLVGRLRLEQELAADALAASVTGGREAYLMNLAALALRRSDASIAWPARAFLPSRHMFLRRVEMLRDPKFAVDRSGWLLRVGSVVALLLFGLLISGVRPDTVEAQSTVDKPSTTSDSDETDPSPTAEQANAETTGEIVAYMPNKAFVVITVHARELLNDPSVEPHAKEIKELFADTVPREWETLRKAGASPSNIESMAVGAILRGKELAFAIRLREPVDRQEIEEASKSTSTVLGGIIYELPRFGKVAIPDDKTILFAEHVETVSAMLIHGTMSRETSPWSRLVGHLNDPTLAVLINSEHLSEFLKKKFLAGKNEMSSALLNEVLSLLNSTSQAGLAVELGQPNELIGYAEGNNQDAAARVSETLKGLITLAQDTVQQFKTQFDKDSKREQVIAETMVPLAEQLLKSAEIKTDGAVVRLHANTGEMSPLRALILPALQQARAAAALDRSRHNLKQIGLAFHNYHNKHGFFPPGVIEENGVKRSWRVEILPFLEQKDLYEQYHKDEPWDSEHNKKIIAKIPDVFRDPSDDSKPNSSSYFMLTSKHAVTNTPRAGIVAPGGGFGAFMPLENATLFTDEPVDIKAGEKGPKIMDFFDGTSNTILVVEASRNVPWTKPEDIPVDPEKIAELLKEDLGGNHDGGFLTLLADGSVHFIPKSITPAKLKKLITPTGGEVIEEVLP